MPKPGKKESKKDYISRCMGDEETNKKYPDQKQRYAVCNSLWDQKKKNVKAVVETDKDETIFE